jgi:arylformamidase
MGKIYDVTVPLSPDLPCYPGDPPFEVKFTHRIADGHPYNVAHMAMGSHTGTHVDAPYHFLADGATAEQLPLEILLGKCRVVELSARERVERADLDALNLRDDLRVLLKTRMSGQLRPGREFQEDFVYLTEDAASYLVQVGIKLVGIDSPSVEKFGSTDYPAHHALLEAGVVIVEGLDLSEVEPGEYDMTCLPLRLVGLDGSPARVILRTRL